MVICPHVVALCSKNPQGVFSGPVIYSFDTTDDNIGNLHDNNDNGMVVMSLLTSMNRFMVH